MAYVEKIGDMYQQDKENDLREEGGVRIPAINL